MFRRCPSCKGLFQAEEVKMEQLGAYEVQEQGYRGILGLGTLKTSGLPTNARVAAMNGQK